MKEKELKDKIKQLQKELVVEKKNNGLSKRAIFLEATIRVYTEDYKKIYC